MKSNRPKNKKLSSSRLPPRLLQQLADRELSRAMGGFRAPPKIAGPPRND